MIIKILRLIIVTAEKHGIKHILIQQAHNIHVGLLYTTNYVDFDEHDWLQVSVNPPEFEARTDFVTLDIFDVTQKSYKIKFAKGTRVRSLRVVGKFRLTWEDSGLLEKF